MSRSAEKSPRGLTRREFLQLVGATASGLLATVAAPETGHAEPLTAQTEKPPTNEDEAAKRFGASFLTREPSNWAVTRYGDGVTGSEYKMDEQGRHTRAGVGRAVISEGFWDLPQYPEDSQIVRFFEGSDTRAVAFVFNGTEDQWAKYVDAAGTTNFAFPTQQAQADRLPAHWNEFYTKEGLEQPGAIRVPINFAPECPADIETLGAITTPEAAAKKYGVDEYSKNPANWTISYYDNRQTIAATLNFDTAQYRTTRIHELGGTMVEGWMGVKGDESSSVPFFVGKERAITFVADGRVTPTLDVRGATLWQKFDNARTGQLGDLEGNLNLLFDQMTKREGKEQPGALVLPFGFEPDLSECPTN